MYRETKLYIKRRVLLDCQVLCVLLNNTEVGKLYMQYICVCEIDVIIITTIRHIMALFLPKLLW